MHDHEQTCACCAGRDIIADEDAAIAATGVNFQAVFGDDDGPGFVYTSGLSEKGLADLIFVGDHTEPAADYLLGFVATQLDDGAPTVGGLVPPGDPRNGYDVPVWLADGSDKLRTHALGVESRLRRIGSDRPARLLQVVMPDRTGRFPWEPGYAWLDQKVVKTPVAGNA